MLTDLSILIKIWTKLENGPHNWIEHIKTHKIDIKFASFGHSYRKIWISKVHL